MSPLLCETPRFYHPNLPSAADFADFVKTLPAVTRLCIIAHPDDAEFGCFNLIRSCLHHEHQLLVVVVTNGRNCPLAGSFAIKSKEEVEELRIQEQKVAAEIGKFSVIHLRYDSARLRCEDKSNAVSDLAAIVAETSADEIWTHNPFDRHRTHISVLKRLLEALGELPVNKRPTLLRGAELWGSIDHLPERYLERTPVPAEDLDLLQALVSAFKSQVEAKDYVRGILGRLAAHATFSDSHRSNPASFVQLCVPMHELLEDDVDLEAWVTGILDEYSRMTMERLRES